MPSVVQRLLAAFGLLVALGVVAGGAWWFLTPPTEVTTTAKGGERQGCLVPAPRGPKQQFFVGLPKPEVVLVLSGQMHGYLQPCGCARPQLGGLERRYELIEGLRQRGWSVSAADLGELAPEKADEQNRVKFETSLQILKKLDYAAVGMGLSELQLPLDQALGIAQNWQPPHVLAANLNDKDAQYPEMFRPWFVHEAGLKIAYVGLIGDKVAQAARVKDPSLTFDPIDQALPVALKELDAKQPDLRVLLYQGSREEARELARKYPQFAVILTQDLSDEPSGKADVEGKTMLVSLGHKGKYVGVLGAFRHAVPIDAAMARDGFQLKYELAALTEHYELPDEATNPARDLMRDYVLRIQGGSFLSEAKWPKTLHPTQLDFPEAKYVGAAACKECHAKSYGIWAGTRHSHAYESVVECGRPIAQRNRDREQLPPLRVGREYDPDCIRCHATGFEYKTGFVNATASKHLLGNQCENCHGPASLHVAFPKEPKYVKPLQLKAGKPVEMNLCRKCHDPDNDPKFDFDLYWPRVRHPDR